MYLLGTSSKYRIYECSFLGIVNAVTSPVYVRFETALRLKDPSVSIPYWASNLDAEMEDPTKSVIWSEAFFGNGDGFVTTGPFANFKVYTTDSILTRNIGTSGSLMTNEGIHGILSRNRTADITNPTAPKQYNLELQHNTVHAWMGGNMDDLSQSAEDPVFYLHHSFVDYLWEEFRTRQKMYGIDPETDYPQLDWGDAQHAPDAPIGFGDLRNIDALSNVLADLVKYDPSPACTRSHPTCISKYLRCDSSRPYPVCVSLSREEMEGEKEGRAEVCVEAHLTRAVQNSFSINQYCDIRKWAYIPVKILLQRPPEFTNYKAFPVLNNKPVMDRDVFSTISVNKNISEHLAAYPNCKLTSSVARQIFVESYGLNYYGKYKDFTVLDQRHALSSSTTYLGVKSPESNYTDVIVYAFDYCGRSCRPFCLDATSNPPKQRPCSGVIRVTSETPKLYGDDYAEALNMLWSADGPDDLPQSAPLHFITFYCDYSGTWPWDEDLQRKSSVPAPNAHSANHDTHHSELVEPVLRESAHSTVVVETKSVQDKPLTSKSVVSSVLHNMPVTSPPKVDQVKPPVISSPRITIIRARRKQSAPTQTSNHPKLTEQTKPPKQNVVVLDLSDATWRPPVSAHQPFQPSRVLSHGPSHPRQGQSGQKLFQHQRFQDIFHDPLPSPTMNTLPDKFSGKISYIF